MTSIDRTSVELLAEYISPDVRRVMLAQADRIEELEAKLVVKEGVYGRFKVSKNSRGDVLVWMDNSEVALSRVDFAEASALFTALLLADGMKGQTTGIPFLRPVARP